MRAHTERGCRSDIYEASRSLVLSATLVRIDVDYVPGLSWMDNEGLKDQWEEMRSQP